MQQVENETIISNVIQGEYWQSKKESFGDKIVLPLNLYNDDFENNNALGSHRGLGKTGGIYVTLPGLPPNMYSKVENIFPISSYKSKDEKYAPLRKFFEKCVEEIIFLENEDIEINVESS